MQKHQLLAVLLFLISHLALANVAKVIITKGEIRAKNPRSKKVYRIKKNDRIKEGTLIQTGSRSFVKMIFNDKSQVSLGPKSQMKVTKFPKKKTGILTLIKGQMRTKVQKDLINDRADKNKLYIRTKTAAMGVRGTEFDTIFNPQSGRTAVITYHGVVQVAQVSLAQFSNKTSYSALRNVVNSKQAAVATSRGTIVNTTSSKDGGHITHPVKMNQAQFNLIEKKGFSTGSVTQSNNQKKKYINPIPPGVNTKKFVNEERGKTVIESLASITDKDTAQKVKQLAQTKVDSISNTELPPPEGKVYSDGSIAPAAGGNVDPKTGAYFPPPAGSTFDPITKTYTAPESYGTYDKSTGDFIPPKGTRVDLAGNIVNDSSNGLGKNIASVKNKTKTIKTVSLLESANSAATMDVAKADTGSDSNYDYQNTNSNLANQFAAGGSDISEEEFVEQFEQQALPNVFNVTPEQTVPATVRLNVNVILPR